MLKCDKGKRTLGPKGLRHASLVNWAASRMSCCNRFLISIGALGGGARPNVNTVKIL